eukprot:14336781-Heterocapsa_arctica.AAC.1
MLQCPLLGPCLIPTGWVGKLRGEALVSNFKYLWRAEAMAFSAIDKLHNSVPGMIFHDRMELYESMASKAQTAANHGDMRGTYSIVKRLSGFTI